MSGVGIAGHNERQKATEHRRPDERERRRPATPHQRRNQELCEHEHSAHHDHQDRRHAVVDPGHAGAMSDHVSHDRHAGDAVPRPDVPHLIDAIRKLAGIRRRK
jgi:hypothetical protein